MHAPYDKKFPFEKNKKRYYVKNAEFHADFESVKKSC
jgi:hypothetical protein